jgi:hypothetical protein
MTALKNHTTKEVRRWHVGGASAFLPAASRTPEIGSASSDPDHPVGANYQEAIFASAMRLLRSFSKASPWRTSTTEVFPEATISKTFDPFFLLFTTRMVSTDAYGAMAIFFRQERRGRRVANMMRAIPERERESGGAQPHHADEEHQNQGFHGVVVFRSVDRITRQFLLSFDSGCSQVSQVASTALRLFQAQPSRPD